MGKPLANIVTLHINFAVRCEGDGFGDAIIATTEMQFRTLESILEDLAKAADWFESVGIPTKETRLQAIRNYLFDQLHFPDPRATLDPADHSWLLSDAAVFGFIATQFAKLPSHLLPRRTLKDA